MPRATRKKTAKPAPAPVAAWDGYALNYGKSTTATIELVKGVNDSVKACKWTIPAERVQKSSGIVHSGDLLTARQMVHNQLSGARLFHLMAANIEEGT